MKKNLRCAMMALLTILPIYTLAQQKCETIFAVNSRESSVKLLQELASLKVDAEAASGASTAQMIQRMYKKKYAEAQNSHLDLSLLPGFVEEFRRKAGLIKEEEQARKETAVHNEWSSMQLFKAYEVTESGKVTSVRSSRGEIAIVEDNKIKIIDAKTQQVIKELVDSLPVENAIFGSDNQVISSSFDEQRQQGIITFWDLQTKRKTKTLMGHKHEIKLIKSFADGKKLLSWDSESGKVLVWSLEQISEEKLNITSMLGSVQKFFSRNEKVQALHSISEPELVDSQKTIVTFEHTLKVPDQTLKSPGMVFHTETSSGAWKAERTFKLYSYTDMVVFNPNGSQFVIVHSTEYETNVAFVIDIKTGQTLFKLQDASKATSGPTDGTYYVRDVKYSPDGNKIATTGSFEPGPHPKTADIALIWDAPTGTILNALGDGTAKSRVAPTVTFSFDGSLVYTSEMYEKPVLWRVTGEKIRELSETPKSIFTVISPFSTDNSFVSYDGGYEAKKEKSNIRVWLRE